MAKRISNLSDPAGETALQNKLNDAWKAALKNGTFCQKLVAKGFPESGLEPEACPLSIKREGQGEGVALALLIAFAKGAAGAAGAAAFGFLWNEIVWPTLKHDFGSKPKIEDVEDPNAPNKD